ncbi:MAG: cell wall-binding repeat-containing protein [Gracilibacteraceae bacterium]|jgi:putative cell wall-binding protein|nr:cell wall-binding repeat-containing protein [Gracilibacteraceae bacterium]
MKKLWPILLVALILLSGIAQPLLADVSVEEYISGKNRVETSVAISRYGWISASTVILASGANRNLIDALAVAPLAGQEDAPILLSVDNRLDPVVIAEIKRLGARKVYVVGALDQRVTDQLNATIFNLEVEVLRGKDRYETADLINAKVKNPRGGFLIGANALADAVSAAPYAAANAYIIMLARPTGEYHSYQADFLRSTAAEGGGVSYVLGGPGLVHDVPGVPRIYGANRYATNKALRETLEFANTHVYMADGEALVDALTGSVLAAKNRAAIVLAPFNQTARADFGDITASTRVYAFGGAK